MREVCRQGGGWAGGKGGAEENFKAMTLRLNLRGSEPEGGGSVVAETVKGD